MDTEKEKTAVWLSSLFCPVFCRKQDAGYFLEGLI